QSDHHVVFFRRADSLPKLRCLFARSEPDLVEFFWKFLLKKIQDLLRLRRPGGVLDPGINVFRVFTEDHHVDFLRMFDGRGDAFEVLHWAQTNEKIEKLPERDVERTNAAPDRRRQRTFDADQIFAKGFDRVVRQPAIEFVLGRLTREHFEPCYFLFAADHSFHPRRWYR